MLSLKKQGRGVNTAFAIVVLRIAGMNQMEAEIQTRLLDEDFGMRRVGGIGGQLRVGQLSHKGKGQPKRQRIGHNAVLAVKEIRHLTLRNKTNDVCSSAEQSIAGRQHSDEAGCFRYGLSGLGALGLRRHFFMALKFLPQRMQLCFLLESDRQDVTLSGTFKARKVEQFVWCLVEAPALGRLPEVPILGGR